MSTNFDHLLISKDWSKCSIEEKLLTLTVASGGETSIGTETWTSWSIYEERSDVKASVESLDGMASDAADLVFLYDYCGGCWIRVSILASGLAGALLVDMA